MPQLNDAQELLKKLGFDRQRTNIMAARTLLALAQLTPDQKWDAASNPRIGVRSIMDWMRNELDFQVAENTRETIRRFVLKQFVEAGFCLHNDDDPGRPTNSSKNVYRLSDEALAVIRSYQRDGSEKIIGKYLKSKVVLTDKYAKARELSRFNVTLPQGEQVSLKRGGQNQLIEKIIADFCPQFIPDAQVLYIGDADSKEGLYDKQRLSQLGVELPDHGKMPDLIVYQPDKHWLFLIEACSTHGPIDHWRYSELESLFSQTSAGLVYVSCFPNRSTLRKFIADLAWETEAWIAEEPTHMLHLNGSRFMGPYS